MHTAPEKENSRHKRSRKLSLDRLQRPTLNLHTTERNHYTGPHSAAKVDHFFAASDNDGRTKAGGVLSSLKRHYYGEGSQAKPGILVGSWGKETAGRPPRGVDMYFELPSDVYYRFERHLGNRQSALLQEVKNIVGETYPSTKIPLQPPQQGKE